MIKRSIKYVIGAVILAALFIAACRNVVMESWWDDPEGGARRAYSASSVYHRVIFDARGGYPAPDTQYISHGGRIAKLPPMAREGYGFGGWYTDETHANEWDLSSGRVNSDLILFARWEPGPVIYTVTFEPQGGNPRPPEQMLLPGTKAIEPSALRRAIAPGSDTWFGFGGWYTDAAGRPGSEWDFAIDRVNSDITLYAVWSDPPHCIVSFEANGGDLVPRTQDLIQGTKIVEPLAMYKTGYGFDGWYTDPDFIHQWDFANDVVDAGTLTLYAHWVTNYYTVIFEAGGGSPAPVNQRIAHYTTIHRPPAMKQHGMAFMGWYTNADFSPGHEWDFNEDRVTHDLTLFAKWEEAEHFINFDLKLPPGIFPPSSGHGNPVPASQDINPGGRIAEPAPVTVSGWSFVGWYYSDIPNFNPENASQRNALIEWDFDRMVNDDNFDDDNIFTLYARWVPFVPGMVWVQKGSFNMGASGSGTSPMHSVRISSGFYMGKYQIVQEEYDELLRSVGLAGFNPDPSQFRAGQVTRPVERVSWYDTVVYCNLRSLREGLTPVYSLNGVTNPAAWGSRPLSSPSPWDNMEMNGEANGYRLPSEAEWEYSAKGGNGSPGGFNFSGSNDADDVGWFTTNSGSMTHPVGTKAPNGLGIYDMNGNVSEWCWDWYGSTFYSGRPNPDIDPLGPASGTERVRRGGAWNNSANNVRNVVRNSSIPTQAEWVNGFRVVRGPAEIY